MVASQQPRDVFEVELAIAKQVADATKDFDPAEIARLKLLAGVIDVVPKNIVRRRLILKGRKDSKVGLSRLSAKW